MTRIPQPPVDPLRRDPEHHDFWPGFILVVIAIALIGTGATHVTSVETTDGDSAWEAQLIKAFSCGGLLVEDAVPVTDPALFDDPAAAAAALEELAQAEEGSFLFKYVVNTGASDPCPT